MKCLCGSELIWSGDHDYSDYGMEGEGVVSNLSCPECDSFVLVYSPSKKGKKLVEILDPR